MNQLQDIVERVANYGGPPMTFRVPDDAAIRLSDSHGGHLLNGAVISSWPEDGE